MKTLKTLSATLALTLVLTGTALAGITESPPCAPGETSTPPCATAQPPSDESEITGQLKTPTANGVSELWFTDVVLDLIQGTLFLF